MGKMLNLVEGLLWQIRSRQQIGRFNDAFSLLTRLSRLRELPRSVAEETQARLGEVCLQRKRFRRAHRHLTLALRYDPDNARYHYLLAIATRRKDREQWQQALNHYRRALDLNPELIECLIEFGLYAVKHGADEEGIQRLRQAVALKPVDPAVLSKLIKGLRWAGRRAEARAELLAARFRYHGDARFQQLWSDFQFRQLRRRQLCDRIRFAIVPEGPILLPFLGRPERAVSAPVMDGTTSLALQRERGPRIVEKRQVK